MKIETKCIQEGYKPGNGQPRVLPIYQSTTYKYDSAEHVGKLFDLEETGHFYSRISNPTVEAVENKIASLEGGVGALCTISGQAATMLAVLNILSAGDHMVSAASIYGGSTNLFGVTLKRLGIEVTFVDQRNEAAVRGAFRKNTKALFGETIANPALTVLDIEKMAKIAHENGVPLIVDNTFATPVLCRPIEWGADIVMHSTSKYMDGHAVQLGGVIVDSGNFDWTKDGRFPELTEPDESYHGVSYTQTFGRAAYVSKARLQLVRDMGVYPPASAAFLLNLGLETLALRMERHSQNALRVAEFLSSSEKVASVNYPGLPGNPYYKLARKYVPGGCSGVVSFEVKGGKDAAVRFLDSLKLAAIVVHVADARTGVLHPASSTHRQLTDEQLAAAGVTPGLVRISVGIENIDDIIEDIVQALEKV